MSAVAGVIDIPTFSDEKVPDESAVADDTLRCEECGKPIQYSGRGRKPKRCEEHRKSGGTKSPRKSLGSNETLAAQATEALIQANGLLALGLMFAHMPVTASSLKEAEDGFREQAYNALLTDPALCKTILKAGTTGGRTSLIIAYGMLAGAVVPVGLMEFKANRAEAAEKRAALEAESVGA